MKVLGDTPPPVSAETGSGAELDLAAVLAPAVLAPAVLAPAVLAPAVLAPAVLAPAVLAPASVQHAGLRPGGAADDPFGRVARLAAMTLGTSMAAVIFPGESPAGGHRWDAGRAKADRWSLIEESLCQHVIDSDRMLIIDDARLELPTSAGSPNGSARVIAWAGFPVRDPGDRAVGALCVADRLPRHWSDYDLEVLQILAAVASGEIALQVAVAHGTERAELARTLQESLLPPRLPKIPGLQIAARYVAGGTGAEVLGDFYDVFPSVRGSWGLVVGDVCGKGVPAAKSTALARYTLRAEAHRKIRPSVILAGLNQALLDWPTADRRFLTAIYAAVRPTIAGAVVQISSGGHPLALVRRADGSVQPFGRPGTLLGLLADPELHDSRRLLRAGDSLILFTDGVTEARSRVDRELFGEERLGEFVAGLGNLSAGRMADAILKAVRTFSHGEVSDDAVVLVLKVPWRGPSDARVASSGRGADAD